MSEIINRLHLAGFLRDDPLFDERKKSVKAYIDVGMVEAVPVSIYLGKPSNLPLARQFREFHKGDYVQVRCFVKPWVITQNNGNQRYGLAIDVLEILNSAESLNQKPADVKPNPRPRPPGPRMETLTRYSADSPPANWQEKHQ